MDTLPVMTANLQQSPVSGVAEDILVVDIAGGSVEVPGQFGQLLSRQIQGFLGTGPLPDASLPVPDGQDEIASSRSDPVLGMDLMLASSFAQPQAVLAPAAGESGKNLPRTDQSPPDTTATSTSVTGMDPALAIMANLLAVDHVPTVSQKLQTTDSGVNVDRDSMQSVGAARTADHTQPKVDVVLDKQLLPPTDTSRMPEHHADQPMPISAGASQALSFNALIVDQARPPSAGEANMVTNPTIDIPPRVDTGKWGESLGEKVIWMVGNQTQGAELRLNPPALGPLEVRVSMSEGQATLSFMTPHAAVREAIEVATPRLREMLGDSGINLGGVSVNVGTFTQQNSFSRETPQGSNNWNPAAQAMDEEVAQGVMSVARPLPGRGMVDLFA